MVPTEGEEAAATAFLQRAGKRGDGYAHSGHLVVVVAVLDDRDETQVSQWQIHFYVLFYLPVGKFGEAIEVFVGLVDQFKELAAISALEYVLAGEFAHVQIVAFLNHLRYL